MHKQTDMIEIETEDGEHLTLTGTHTHNVFYYEDGKPTPTYAENLSWGNVIVGGSGQVVSTSTVHILTTISITTVKF